MDALLILSGLTLFLLGWGWLILSAIGLSLPKLLLAVLLPVVTLVLPRRGFDVAPRLLLGAGLLVLLAGVVQLYQQDRDRFDLLLSGSWLGLGEDQHSLSGRIAGQRFVPDRVTWRNNELLFEEGPADRVRRALSIRFDNAQTLLEDTAIQKVPADGDPWPELVLQWYEGALESPGLRKVTGPYSLSLRFTPGENGRVPLYISLTLPEEHSTWLRGDAELRSPPPWLAALLVSRAQQPPPVERAAPPVATPQPALPRWGDLSLLAVIDEPEPFVGSTIRLTMLSGRVHEGRLARVSEDRRIVLAQQRGPSVVEFQFNPVDVARIEQLSVR